MLLQFDSSLEEIIVRVLARAPRVTAAWLEERITKDFAPYSRRGIYKELTKLESQGVVVKVKNSYSLRLAWVVDFLSFAEDLSTIYLEADSVRQQIESDRERTKWKFRNLTKMDLVWMHLMLGLHRLYPDKAMCIYCPYQWFGLAHENPQRQFTQANEITKNRRYHMVGNRSFLDKLSEKHMPKSSVYSFSAGPFEHLRSTYYTLIGDHIITSTLDKVTTDRLEALYGRVRSEKDLQKENLREFFAVPVKATLMLERSPSKANRLKRKFADFFGVTLEQIG